MSVKMENLCANTVCERDNPCLSGSTCVPVDVTGFDCICPKAYTGKLCDTVKWLKINSSPVCFGTKDSSFGQFNITVPGQIITFKLVHVSGSVNCNEGFPIRSSHWGCRDDKGNPERMNSVITDNNDTLILPQDEFFTVNRERLEYKLPGYDEMSKEVIFKNISVPLGVRCGDEFRIWYGQDLTNKLEKNNGGTTCCDVYALYE
ncbi:uncharacterized protein LOC116308945 [Actinia tenebrosa]|uniref:Uncharacterized protein LOC116308945 n=1 Tax=Actinia tenebrosa TaxID=6105 RepID=A0A6P8J6E6_ACTTE|nr:uncharacterized protein LOC116308945 [Actinia tenebrosa]